VSVSLVLIAGGEVNEISWQVFMINKLLNKRT
jgi:hypothetical protein